MTEKKQLHDSCTLHKHGHETEHGCECNHQHTSCCGGQHAEHQHICCEAEHMAEVRTVLAADGEGVLTRTYLLQGLGCANCGAKIERAVGQLPEVEAALLTFATKKLQVQVKSGADLLAAVQEVCDSIEEGISVEESGAAAKQAGAAKSKGLSARQRSLAEIISGGVLFIAAEWLGVLPEAYHLPALLVAYLILGRTIIMAAARSLLKGHALNENFLMTIATLGAFVINAWEEAVGVMLFYRVGEYFEELAVEKSRSQIMEAVDLRPETVQLETADGVREIDAAAAKVGDVLLVRVGDRIPLDGVIVEGESLLDTSAITGEPVPVAVRSGDRVMSGCVNTSGMLRLRVEKVLSESMVSRILDSVEKAAASKPHIDRFITRFARVYTPVVVGLAALTAIVPSLVTGDWQYWIYTALTFLVISCPCALVLSVPLAFFSGIGAASRRGILFKGGIVIEALKNVAAVVLDKTGTVTKGEFAVQKLLPAEGVTEEELLQLCAGAEQASVHPIAVSIVQAARSRGMEMLQPESFQEVAGEGLAVRIGTDELLCGNRKLMQRYGVADVPQAEAVSGSEVLAARNGQFLGRIIISDTLKADAAMAVKKLQQQGLAVIMLTGDSQEEAEAVAKQAGIKEAHGRLLPQDKFTHLQQLREKYGPVMFVGDGINDAPVLAGADVGAAMGSGADAAIEAADVVFMKSDMGAVPQALALARSTASIAWQNVVFALAVKAAIMAAGVFGYASMWAAVFADSGVALLCVLNSIRLLYMHR